MKAGGEALRKRRRTSMEERKAARPGNERGNMSQYILCLYKSITRSL